MPDFEAKLEADFREPDDNFADGHRSEESDFILEMLFVVKWIKNCNIMLLFHITKKVQGPQK